MQIDYSKLGSWEAEKAEYLAKVARKLGMELSGYGEVGVNPNSGYTYIWLEDYPFVLYMPIDVELQPSDVYVQYSDPEDGEETERTLDTFSSLDDIYDWVSDMETGLEDEELEMPEEVD